MSTAFNGRATVEEIEAVEPVEPVEVVEMAEVVEVIDAVEPAEIVGAWMRWHGSKQTLICWPLILRERT